jgi:hypothetical protein
MHRRLEHTANLRVRVIRHRRRAIVVAAGRRSASLTRWRLPERHELSSGLPVPREPAYAAKRSHDGEAPAAFE